MTNHRVDDIDSVARSVFAGLTPDAFVDEPVYRPMNSTMPILLVGAMAVGMTATTPVDHPSTRPAPQPSTGATGTLVSATRALKTAVLPAPSSYTVVAGDTVSAIAARYGLSAASVLALNGLSRTSLIFPGQKLILVTTVAPVAATPIATSAGLLKYTIVRGDTISAVATRHGVATSAVLAANGLGWSTVIHPGQVISIPGQGAAPVTSPPASSAPATAPTTGSYVIQKGDSVTRIAAKFGVSVQAILDANGLTRSSIIYAGRTLTIPGVAAPSTTPAGTGSGTITLLADDQLVNAATIVDVGRSLGVSDFGLVVALAAAMQESSLRNISYGHLDSVGLFQQRPSAGWGSVAQLTNPSYAARLFFGGPSNPNKGKTRGLLEISGWQSMTVTQAAQKVQVSAYPNAYAKWEASARFWLSELA